MRHFVQSNGKFWCPLFIRLAIFLYPGFSNAFHILSNSEGKNICGEISTSSPNCCWEKRKEEINHQNRNKNVFILRKEESKIRAHYWQSTWKSRLYPTKGFWRGPPMVLWSPAESIVLEDQAMNWMYINISYEPCKECQGKCTIHAQCPKRALSSPVAWAWLISHILGGLRFGVLGSESTGSRCPRIISIVRQDTHH